MGRRRGIPSALLPFLIVAIAAAVGCGRGPAAAFGGRATPHEASLGGPQVPAGFGEGSLWATDIFVCDDTGPAVFGGFGDGGRPPAALPRALPSRGWTPAPARRRRGCP